MGSILRRMSQLLFFKSWRPCVICPIVRLIKPNLWKKCSTLTTICFMVASPLTWRSQWRPLDLRDCLKAPIVFEMIEPIESIGFYAENLSNYLSKKYNLKKKIEKKLRVKATKRGNFSSKKKSEKNDVFRWQRTNEIQNGNW